jgi:Na+/H+-dicarboxylate symporter
MRWKALSYVMLKVTMLVMWFAPFAVFAAVAAAIAKSGPGIRDLRLLHGRVLSRHPDPVVAAVRRRFAVLGGRAVSPVQGRARTDDAGVRDGIERSRLSEDAGPAGEVRLCSNRVASFVLPLGYSFNLDGSMMYCTFAVMFIAQAYGIELSAAQQLTMLLILMVTSKGMAGVPRASLVVIAATLAQFNIPEAGLLLLLGIDHFLDMGRSATNVIGNSVATAVVSKWEGQLRSETDIAADLANAVSTEPPPAA